MGQAQNGGLLAVRRETKFIFWQGRPAGTPGRLGEASLPGYGEFYLTPLPGCSRVRGTVLEMAAGRCQNPQAGRLRYVAQSRPGSGFVGLWKP